MKHPQKTLLDALGIQREVFRYWRRLLDRSPNRTGFTYHVILAYAVIRVLVRERYYSPKDLRCFDMSELFMWFEAGPDEQAIEQTVVEVDKRHRRVSIRSLDGTYQIPFADSSVEVIYLREVAQPVRQAILG